MKPLLAARLLQLRTTVLFSCSRVMYYCVPDWHLSRVSGHCISCHSSLHFTPSPNTNIACVLHACNRAQRSCCCPCGMCVGMAMVRSRCFSESAIRSWSFWPNNMGICSQVSAAPYSWQAFLVFSISVMTHYRIVSLDLGTARNHILTCYFRRLIGVFPN